MYIRLDTVPALDGRTDGQNCQNNIALCVHCMLTSDKNIYYIYYIFFITSQIIVI